MRDLLSWNEALTLTSDSNGVNGRMIEEQDST